MAARVSELEQRARVHGARAVVPAHFECSRACACTRVVFNGDFEHCLNRHGATRGISNVTTPAMDRRHGTRSPICALFNESLNTGPTTTPAALAPTPTSMATA